MLKLKSQVTCSYCSKTFKDPILLPCEDSICRQHLTEKAAVKQNKIICKKCNNEFGVKENQFKSNEVLTRLIEGQSYLSGEKICLKQELEGSIQKFFEYYEFIQNKSILESNVYNHFQEIRFQIDEQREELKKRIDDIALAMIDQAKKHEEKYLQDLKETLFETSYFEKTKSLEDELTGIEDTFRNPMLLIQTIRDMQREQEESLNEIQFKLNEMNRVKDNLMATNEFKPNLSWFDQNETSSLFGLIKFSLYSDKNPFKSQVLKSGRQSFELIRLCEFSPNDKWSLLYRATRDGFTGRDFHSKCDGHSNTLTILKAKHGSYIFGGFTKVSWNSSRRWKSDRNAFLFSLTNKDNQPLKMKVDPNRHKYAIDCDSRYGPSFGYDIRIANNANTTMDSYSQLGLTYKHPQYGLGTNEALTFLAGKYEFQLAEIEVFQKE